MRTASFRRLFAVAATLVISLLASLLRIILLRRRRPHPALKRHFVVSLNLPDIRRAALEGNSFSLTLGKKTVEVMVEPEMAIGSVEIIEVDQTGETVRLSVDQPIAYAGRVVNAGEDNDVRLTMTDNWLTGYVHDGREWWFIEPMRTFRKQAAADDYLVYRTKDLRFKIDLSDDTLPKMVEQSLPDSLPPDSGYLETSPTTTPVPVPVAHKVGPAIGIAVVADREYNDQAKMTGTPWYMYQIGVLNNVNGLYKNNVGCWFVPKTFLLTYKGLSNYKADLLLKDLEAVVKQHVGDLRQVATRENLGIECVHLTSGKNLDGKTLGIAWEPGVHSLSQQQLYWIGGGGGWGGPNLAFQNMMLMAHEIGHNFFGDHAEADEWCVSHFLWCWDYERSLMWETFYSDNNPWISDGSRDPKHNNRKRMKDNMADDRAYNF